MVGLREKNKEKNRRRIIDSAHRLIVAKASTNFTMAELAREAEVSTFTTYNLIGSKAAVLYLLLNNLLDEIVLPSRPTTGKRDAIDYFLESIDGPLKLFAEQEAFYRVLFRFLFGSTDEKERARYQARTWNYWKRSTAALSAAALFPPGVEPADLIRAAHTGFTGSLELWIHGELTSTGLRSQVLSNLALLLMSLGDIESRAMLHDVLENARSDIPRLVSGQIEDVY